MLAARTRPSTKDVTRRVLTTSGEHPLGSTTSSRPTSSHNLCGELIGDTSDAPEAVQVGSFAHTEAPTHDSAYPLEVRLDKALLAISERDARIRELMEQVEILASNRPAALLDGAPSDGSEAQAEATPQHPTACESTQRPEIVAQDDAQTRSDVRWHSVSIGAPVRASVAPGERSDTRRAVELEVVFEPETQFYTGLTQDISGGGVFIATYSLQPVGTLLSLSFELPCGTVISAFGEVRWLRDGSEEIRPGMGVAFIGLAEESKTAIEHFCEASSSLYMDL